jgi:ATP-dependent HslUV protease ATP-binding subunit HslU
MAPIYLPERSALVAEALTPRQIVAELDKHVVGQAKAKRAVAIALRNRYRRQRLPAEMAEEVAPKNILMIGPTGVGKTEIARRLAKLAQSPFLKVEASKFTEVGYVGRDVESMVRDLVEIAVQLVREEREAEVREKARQAAEERLLDLLLPPVTPSGFGEASTEAQMARDQAASTRERLREQLRAGRLDTKTVEVEAQTRSMPSFEVIQGSSVEEIGVNLSGDDALAGELSQAFSPARDWRRDRPTWDPAGRTAAQNRSRRTPTPRTGATVRRAETVAQAPQKP